MVELSRIGNKQERIHPPDDAIPNEPEENEPRSFGSLMFGNQSGSTISDNEQYEKAWVREKPG